MSLEKYLKALENNTSFTDVIYERELTKAELEKREEVAKAMERENPNIDMSKKMATATSVAKKVLNREDVELEESVNIEKKKASLEKKIKDKTDALGLARERRKMKGGSKGVQGAREIKLASEISALRSELHSLNVNEEVEQIEESSNMDGAYWTAKLKIEKEKLRKRGMVDQANNLSMKDIMDKNSFKVTAKKDKFDFKTGKHFKEDVEQIDEVHSPFKSAGHQLEKHAEKLGKDHMDYEDFKSHASLLKSGNPSDWKTSAESLRHLDTGARDTILQHIDKHVNKRKEMAAAYYKASGHTKIKEDVELDESTNNFISTYHNTKLKKEKETLRKRGMVDQAEKLTLDDIKKKYPVTVREETLEESSWIDARSCYDGPGKGKEMTKMSEAEHADAINHHKTQMYQLKTGTHKYSKMYDKQETQDKYRYHAHKAALHKDALDHHQMYNEEKDVNNLNYLDAKEERKDRIRKFIKKVSKATPKRVPGKQTVQNEEVEIDEAVEIAHDRVLRSHGKKNTHTGHALWMFTNKRTGDVDYDNEKECHQVSATRKDAQKSAKEWAKKHGHSKIYFMESVERIDELSDKTLDSYQEKSKKEIDDKIKSGDFKGVTKRNKGMISSIVAKHRNALKNLTKEEVELDENKYSSGGLGPYFNRVGTKVKIHTNHKNAGKTGTIKKVVDSTPTSGKQYHVEHEDGTHAVYGREHVRRIEE